jgi:hypothetical protein
MRMSACRNADATRQRCGITPLPANGQKPELPTLPPPSMTPRGSPLFMRPEGGACLFFLAGAPPSKVPKVAPPRFPARVYVGEYIFRMVHFGCGIPPPCLPNGRGVPVWGGSIGVEGSWVYVLSPTGLIISWRARQNLVLTIERTSPRLQRLPVRIHEGRRQNHEHISSKDY